MTDTTAKQFVLERYGERNVSKTEGNRTGCNNGHNPCGSGTAPLFPGKGTKL